MEENRKKPQIRFEGYTDDWEQRKLCDVLSLLKDGTHGTHKDSDYGPFLLSAKNIKNGQIIIDDLSDRRISQDAFDQIHSTFKLQKDDVLLTIVGSIGETAILENADGLTFQRSVAFLRPNGEMTSRFLRTEIEADRFQKELQDRKSQSAQPGVYLGELEKIPVIFPKIGEQKKIADYFSNLDNLITLHQRKYNKLVDVKKSMLEKMFPKNGEKKPEIRFCGFTDDWEQRKLSEIYASIGNAFVGTATPYYVEQGHFYLESNNIKDGQINHNSEVFINDEFYERQKEKWLHTGDMVMVQSGHVGHAAVIPEELDNSAAHALIMFREPKEKIEPYFLNYQYQTNKIKKKIDGITTGNTIKHILASDMQEFVVDLPDYNEQKQIGDYFRNLDHLITLHQREVEKLKNIKKSMLEKMFI